ncbi:MAG: GNAT family N-acetyltransferase, partial [Thermoproteota archaeon]
WDALRKESKRAIGVINPSWSVHRALTLEGNPGFLLERMRSKHRSWVKRKEKELLEAFSDKVKWSWHSNSIDILSICTKLEAVAKTTYQRGLGAGFVDDYETRKRLSLFAKRNQLRVMLLELDGEPSSFWYGVVYKSTFHASATGYRPDMARYEMGTLALLKMVDYLIAEGIEKLDFGLGDAYYKERFSDISWKEASVQLFSDTMRGKMLRNYLQAASWLENNARKFAEKLKFAGRAKKIWRLSIAPKEPR